MKARYIGWKKGLHGGLIVGLMVATCGVGVRPGLAAIDPVSQVAPSTPNYSSSVVKTTSQQASASSQPQLSPSFGKLPLHFEANQGQADSSVKFLSRGSGYTMFLTPTEAVMVLRQNKGQAQEIESTQPQTIPAPSELEAENPETTASVLRMSFSRANEASTVTGQDKLSGIVNYFIGNDPNNWRTKIPMYKKVQYNELYEGIDLVYYGNQGQLEYDLVVAPGADPTQIQIAFQGTEKISVDPATGDLVLTLQNPRPLGVQENGARQPTLASIEHSQVRLLKPHVYQLVDGKRVEVSATYRVRAASEPGFNSLSSSTHHASLFIAGEVSESVNILLAAYDRTKPLIIDPILDWSTYLGTPAVEESFGVAVDSAGAVYVTGFTTTSGFPGTSGSLIQPAPAGGSDAFVAKMNSTGTAIDYATYLGTSPAGDAGHGIAVDAAGAAYVTGITNGAGFPGTSGSLIQPGFGGGNSDAFIAKLNPTGTAIDYATYLGTAGVDGGLGIAVDGAGAAYAIGQTNGAGFPGTSGSLIQPALQGIFDAFVAKINSAGTAIDYATYLGTSGDDRGEAIAVNAAGEAYVTGSTSASGFPGVSVGSIQPAHAGGSDAFVAKLNGGGTAVEYATYLGTTGFDVGWGITSDAAGAAYVIGETSGTGFPGTSGSLIQSGFAGGFRDAFVVKLAPAGDLIQYGTYLGTSGDDRGRAIAVNAMGAVSVTGQTDGVNFPGTVGSTIQDTNAGDVDGFVAKLTREGDAIDYATYLGTAGADILWSIALDAAGAGHISGEAGGSFLPGTSPSSIQPTYFANQDGLVSKICDDPPLGASPGTWAATAGNLTEARARSTSTLLPDGRVLIAGGGTDINSLAPQSTNSANLYDPSTGLFTATGSLLASRFEHTATLLASGQVLIAGGEDVADIHDIADLYDPSTGLFSATTNTLGTPRSRHTATLLADGSVLLVGGNGGGAGTAEIYNPSTGLFSPTTGLLVDLRVDHTATRLADGRVLIIGGSQDGALRTAEIYDPGTGLFTATGEMTERRFDHSATLLSDGRVLVAGGLNELLSGPPDTAEIYDPVTETFGPLLSLTTFQTDHTASLLPDGRVLLAGGLAMESVEFYDPALGTFIRTGDFVEAQRRASSATVLTNGQVLMTGGSVWSNTDTLLSTAELYTPNLCGLEAENTSPEADDQTVSIFEDPTLPVNITLTGSDAETPSENLTFMLTGPGPAHGTLMGTPPNLQYQPDPDYNNDIDGPDSFTFAVEDDDATTPLTSPDATVTLTITPVNDAPSFSAGGNVQVDENTGSHTISGWATNIQPGPVTATDEAGQLLTFLITGNSNPALFSAQPAVDAGTGNLTFVLAANTFGVATINLVLMDDGGTANGGDDSTDVVVFTIDVQDDVPPPPHALTFEINGGAIDLNTWLPEPGTVLTIQGVVTQGGIPLPPAEQPNIIFSLVEPVTAEPGAYTNDPDQGNVTPDFSFGTGDLDDGDRDLVVTAEDYGGRIRLHAVTDPFDGGAGDIVRMAELILPLDNDDDGLADAWEVMHGGIGLFDGTETDAEAGVTGGPAGDGLSAKQKYRGYKWGPPMQQVTAVGNLQPYQTIAWVPDPAAVLDGSLQYDPPHMRGNPTRKDLFVEVENYDFGNLHDATCTYNGGVNCEAPFAMGDAFNEAGIDVYVRSLDVASPSPIGVAGIDVVSLVNVEWFNAPTNTEANRLAQDGLTNPSGDRNWSFDRKGESCIGTESDYQDCPDTYTETYQIPHDHYFDDALYGNGVTFVGDPLSPTQIFPPTAITPFVLDPRTQVLTPPSGATVNANDDPFFNVGTCTPSGAQDLGDHWVVNDGAPCYGKDLSSEDIDNDGRVEFGNGTLEVPGCIMETSCPVEDPDCTLCGIPDVPDHEDLPAFESTRAQVLKRTITHELGHAIGIDHNLDPEVHCLMREDSESWHNDDVFCTNARDHNIDIHNE